MRAESNREKDEGGKKRDSRKDARDFNNFPFNDQSRPKPADAATLAAGTFRAFA
jgi:hypothetical protein